MTRDSSPVVYDPPFAQLIAIAEGIFGARLPHEHTADWPDADERGINETNLVMFDATGCEVFARWFAEMRELELLVVITNVHSETDFSDYLEALGETLPDDFEVHNPTFEVGAPICVALTYDVYTPLSDEQVATKVAQLVSLVHEVSEVVAP